ncbi:unnamed protein product [Amoebophrya sp. A120]|nr:unnamed protein product [Amoebophrya sp. A120]|eukprot:GSA120T00002328001.1
MGNACAFEKDPQSFEEFARSIDNPGNSTTSWQECAAYRMWRWRDGEQPAAAGVSCLDAKQQFEFNPEDLRRDECYVIMEVVFGKVRSYMESSVVTRIELPPGFDVSPICRDLWNFTAPTSPRAVQAPTRKPISGVGDAPFKTPEGAGFPVHVLVPKVQNMEKVLQSPRGTSPPPDSGRQIRSDVMVTFFRVKGDRVKNEVFHKALRQVNVLHRKLAHQRSIGPLRRNLVLDVAVPVDAGPSAVPTRLETAFSVMNDVQQSGRNNFGYVTTPRFELGSLLPRATSFRDGTSADTWNRAAAAASSWATANSGRPGRSQDASNYDDATTIMGNRSSQMQQKAPSSSSTTRNYPAKPAAGTTAPVPRVMNFQSGGSTGSSAIFSPARRVLQQTPRLSLPGSYGELCVPALLPTSAKQTNVARPAASTAKPSGLDGPFSRPQALPKFTGATQVTQIPLLGTSGGATSPDKSVGRPPVLGLGGRFSIPMPRPQSFPMSAVLQATPLATPRLPLQPGLGVFTTPRAQSFHAGAVKPPPAAAAGRANQQDSARGRPQTATPRSARGKGAAGQTPSDPTKKLVSPADRYRQNLVKQAVMSRVSPREQDEQIVEHSTQIVMKSPNVQVLAEDAASPERAPGVLKRRRGEQVAATGEGEGVTPPTPRVVQQSQQQQLQYGAEAENQKMLEKYRPELSEIPCDLDDPSLARLKGSFVYIGASDVARNKTQLLNQGITHIVNAAAEVTDNLEDSDDDSPQKAPSRHFEYLTFYFKDGRAEDISSGFFKLLEFCVQAAETTRKKPRILFHCGQGVSRSCTLCLVYLMHLTKKPVGEVLSRIQQTRPICRPNTGFYVQLLLWQKELGIPNPNSEKPGEAVVADPKLCKIRCHHDRDPFLVLFAVEYRNVPSLWIDPRFDYACFDSKRNKFLVWRGPESVVPEQEAEKLLLQVSDCRRRWLPPNERPVIDYCRDPNPSEAFWGILRSENKGSGQVQSIRSNDDDYELLVKTFGAKNETPRTPMTSPRTPPLNTEVVTSSKTKLKIKPQLFTCPNWDDPMSMPDPDDLDSEFVQLFFAPDSDGEPTIFLWVGALAHPDDKAKANSGKFAEDFLQSQELVRSQVRIAGVEVEKQESDEFWEVFDSV